MYNSPVQPNGIFYVVQPYDTLYEVAGRFRVYYDDILYFNPSIRQSGSMLIGQQLFIPMGACPPDAFLYVVKPGDSLSRISSFFNVPEDQLIEDNADLYPDGMYAGRTLVVSGNPRADKNGKHPHEGKSFIIKATAYGKNGAGKKNRYGTPLTRGMIAVKSYSHLFNVLFPFAAKPPRQGDSHAVNKAMYHSKVRTFYIPSEHRAEKGIEVRGIKVRIDCSKSPYDPLLQGRPTPDQVKQAEKASFEAVVCDTSDVPDIDIFYEIPEALTRPFEIQCVKLTILDQNDPIVRPILEEPLGNEECATFKCPQKNQPGVDLPL